MNSAIWDNYVFVSNTLDHFRSYRSVEIKAREVSFETGRDDHAVHCKFQVTSDSSDLHLNKGFHEIVELLNNRMPFSSQLNTCNYRTSKIHLCRRLSALSHVS